MLQQDGVSPHLDYNVRFYVNASQISGLDEVVSCHAPIVNRPNSTGLFCVAVYKEDSGPSDTSHLQF